MQDNLHTAEEGTKRVLAERRKRLKLIMKEWELTAADVNARIAAPGRFVVITSCGERGFGHYADVTNRQEQIAQTAGKDHHEGWIPVCYYDLDALEGDEPILMEGDRVRFRGEERTVSHHDYEASEGEPYAVVYLDVALNSDDDPDGMPEGPFDPDNEDIELIERAQPDERLPVRYDVAAVNVVVAFNSVPTR